MNNIELVKHLASRNACKRAIKWLGNRDSAQMWADCKRPGWLMWYATNHVTREDLVLVACDCAATALRYVQPGEDRPRLAIEAARSWAKREENVKSVKDAATALSGSNVGAAAMAAYAAAYTAADSFYSPGFAKGVAHYVAEDAARYGGSASDAKAEMCRLIRLRWPTCPEAK